MRGSPYLEAAQDLIRYAHATDAAQASLDHNDLPLEVLPPNDLSGGKDFDTPAFEPLTELVATERAHRAATLEQTRAQLAPSGPIMAQLAIASWLRAGRTAMQHQRQYAELLGSSAEFLDSQGLISPAGNQRYLNDRLSHWLDRVLDGQSMSNATAAMVEDELDRHRSFEALNADQSLPQQLGEVFTTLGSRWQTTIEAMAAAHPGTILALLHRWGTTIDPRLLGTSIDVGPSARIEYRNTSWTVAIVPAATRLQLAERHDHRLCGLVLLENEDTRLIDTNDCIAILRNLANALGNKRAAERARAVPRSTSTSHDWATDEHTIDDLPSFGTGIHDRGLTAADCFPHVRQALQSKR